MSLNSPGLILISKEQGKEARQAKECAMHLFEPVELHNHGRNVGGLQFSLLLHVVQHAVHPPPQTHPDLLRRLLLRGILQGNMLPDRSDSHNC